MQKKGFVVLEIIALIALLAIFSSGLAGCLPSERTAQISEVAKRELPEVVEANEDFFVSVYIDASAGTLVETLPENFTYISCVPRIMCVNVPKEGFSAEVVGQKLTITYSSGSFFVILAYKVKAPRSPVTGAVFSGVFKSTEEPSWDVGGDTTIDVVESNP